MRTRWILLTLTVGLLATAGGCGKATETPTATPDRASVHAASTLFAQPTRSARPTATVTPLNRVELELSRSLARMERAVLAGDAEGYLQYVSDADPVFWAEQKRWVQDWLDHPLRIFDVEVYGIESASDTAATGRLTIRWGQAGRSDEGSSGGATVSARFTLEDGIWKLAGEAWTVAEAEGIRLYYFANDIIDNRSQAATVLEFLSSIHTGVTHEFGFAPQRTAHVKLYESRITLQNFTRLSAHDLQVSNEPGESIKIPLTVNNTAPDEAAIGREYTRFVLFEMAGGIRSGLPWWFEEGISEYGGQRFRPLSKRNLTLKDVAALSLEPANGPEQLLDWDALQVRPDLPADQWRVAVAQSYSLVHYITEAHGRDARNAWIRAIAAGQTVAEASLAHLGVAWNGLEAGWRAWLPTLL